MSKLRKLGLVAVGAMLILQLWPGPRPSNPPVESEPEWSPEVAVLMRKACYDCHSNETAWPWYSYVAPASWVLVDEVERGRGALNFSTWNRVPPHVRPRILERTVSRAASDVMAPPSYRAVHPESRLGPEDEAVLQSWLKAYSEPAPVQRAPNPALFRLPAQSYAGQATLPAGSWRAVDLVRQEPLELAGALLQLEGASRLTGGVRGRGVVVLHDRSELEGPVADEVQVVGRTSGPFRLALPDLSERVLPFCRDDGELGETDERTFHVFYGYGRYLILEPELEVARRAESPDAALQAVQMMLAQDPTTDVALWKRRFRGAWRRELSAMTETVTGATLEFHPGERGPR